MPGSADSDRSESDGGSPSPNSVQKSRFILSRHESLDTLHPVGIQWGNAPAPRQMLSQSIDKYGAAGKD
jgi:hypothetical protein